MDLLPEPTPPGSRLLDFVWLTAHPHPPLSGGARPHRLRLSGVILKKDAPAPLTVPRVPALARQYRFRRVPVTQPNTLKPQLCQADSGRVRHRVSCLAG